MRNVAYKSCYYLFILLPAKGLQFSHVGISNEAEIPLLYANQIAQISRVVVYNSAIPVTAHFAINDKYYSWK